jgi:peptide-methionine (S)-S-oxide reductase
LYKHYRLVIVILQNINMKSTSLVFLVIASLNFQSCQAGHKAAPKAPYNPKEGVAKAYFASGCFWCVEAIFESVYGVEEVVSGYCGGNAEDANYDYVSSGATNHAETVEVYYDSTKVSYSTLLKIFFDSHDPTTLNRQGPDSGRQYRSAIFYRNEAEKEIAQQYISALYGTGQYEAGTISTTLEKFNGFYPAEAYHQDYERLNPNQPYIRAVSIPRLKRFQAKNPELIKKEEAKH